MEILDFGYCKLTVAPVRAAASDASEIITQLLFGDLVEIIEKGQPWIKIRFPQENYEGWMDFKQLSYLNSAEYETLKNNNPLYLKDAMSQINGPEGLQTIFLGSALHQLKGNQMQVGNNTYQFVNLPNQTERSLVETALIYLNTPYLWGGKSLFGIDCSGLVQNCFKAQGKVIPRDASQQVYFGHEIAYTDRQIGDVPFFINTKGIVHHVGILTEKNKIIHAAGQVRVDPFTDQGVFREDLNKFTHHYHSIRRF